MSDGWLLLEIFFHKKERGAMGITLKIILLLLGLMVFIGCIFWWLNDRGWEPIIAGVGALSSVIV